MYFRYNDCVDENKRRVSVAYEILSEYKNITKKQALQIAEEEEIITYRDFLSFKKHAIAVTRLYNIMYYLQDSYSNIIEFNNAYRDLKEEYILYNSKCNKNQKDNLIYRLIKTVNDYTNNNIDRLPSIKQIKKDIQQLKQMEKRRKQYELEHTMEFKPNDTLNEDERIKAVADDILRAFPNMPAKLAKFIATLEPSIEDRKSEIYDHEIRIIRLINIMSNTISIPELDYIYNESFTMIKKEDESLKEITGYDHSSIACVIMAELNKFRYNPDITFPTYASAKAILKESKNKSKNKCFTKDKK